MKMQYKKMCVLLAATMMLAVAGCGQNTGDTAPGMEQGKSDLEYVQSKGTLVVGITDYAPMDYRDGEALRNRKTEVGHLCEVCTLSAEELTHVSVAFTE